MPSKKKKRKVKKTTRPYKVYFRVIGNKKGQYLGLQLAVSQVQAQGRFRFNNAEACLKLGTSNPRDLFAEQITWDEYRNLTGGDHKKITKPNVLAKGLGNQSPEDDQYRLFK